MPESPAKNDDQSYTTYSKTCPLQSFAILTVPKCKTTYIGIGRDHILRVLAGHSTTPVSVSFTNVPSLQTIAARSSE